MWRRNLKTTNFIYYGRHIYTGGRIIKIIGRKYENPTPTGITRKYTINTTTPPKEAIKQGFEALHNGDEVELQTTFQNKEGKWGYFLHMKTTRYPLVQTKLGRFTEKHDTPAWGDLLRTDKKVDLQFNIPFGEVGIYIQKFMETTKDKENTQNTLNIDETIYGKLQNEIRWRR